MPIRDDGTKPDGPVSPNVGAQPVIVIVPATPITVEIRPGRIRDLWAGTLAGTGVCPPCGERLGSAHAEGCKWTGIVGSNKAEHYL